MDERLYRAFYEVEDRHWWFVARGRIFEDLIERRLGLPPEARVLDVGCGTGAMLAAIQRRFPQAEGIDCSAVAIDLCRGMGLTHVRQGTLRTVLGSGERFDLITVLDVLEHVDDDLELLREVGQSLTSGGRVLLSVPAYGFLWSKHDETNEHKRRYSKSQLKRLLVTAGFQLDFVSHFNALLFPAAAVERLLTRLGLLDSGNALRVPPNWLNSLATRVFSAERLMLRWGSMPFGLSLVAIATPSGVSAEPGGRRRHPAETVPAALLRGRP